MNDFEEIRHHIAAAKKTSPPCPVHAGRAMQLAENIIAQATKLRDIAQQLLAQAANEPPSD